jgi:hypothetical protein
MTNRLLPLLITAAIGASVLAGCGSSTNSSPSSAANGAAAAQTTHFAKTKFLFHAGLALGVFHHFIYKPFKDGSLKHPLLHKLTFIKAAAAAALVFHEVKLARQDAASSKLLSKVVLPLAGVGSAMALIRGALLRGKVDNGAINFANSQAARASSAASAAGQPITETTAGAVQ